MFSAISTFALDQPLRPLYICTRTSMLRFATVIHHGGHKQQYEEKVVTTIPRPLTLINLSTLPPTTPVATPTSHSPNPIRPPGWQLTRRASRSPSRVPALHWIVYLVLVLSWDLTKSSHQSGQASRLAAYLQGGLSTHSHLAIAPVLVPNLSSISLRAQLLPPKCRAESLLLSSCYENSCLL